MTLDRIGGGSPSSPSHLVFEALLAHGVPGRPVGIRHPVELDVFSAGANRSNTQASSPLDHGTKLVTGVGVEPTKSQDLGTAAQRWSLLALPFCVPSRVKVAGPGVAPGGSGL